jgi:hypothetical protein
LLISSTAFKSHDADSDRRILPPCTFAVPALLHASQALAQTGGRLTHTPIASHGAANKGASEKNAPKVGSAREALLWIPHSDTDRSSWHTLRFMARAMQTCSRCTLHHARKWLTKFHESCPQEKLNTRFCSGFGQQERAYAPVRKMQRAIFTGSKLASNWLTTTILPFSLIIHALVRREKAAISESSWRQ